MKDTRHFAGSSNYSSHKVSRDPTLTYGTRVKTVCIAQEYAARDSHIHDSGDSAVPVNERSLFICLNNRRHDCVKGRSVGKQHAPGDMLLPRYDICDRVHDTLCTAITIFFDTIRFSNVYR